MSGWTAVLPIKPVAARKTRLATRLAPDARAALSEWLFGRAVAALRGCPAVARIATLSAAPLDHDWFPDRGRGLNAELAAVAGAAPERLLVLHPDLPAIAAGDVTALLAAAESGAAIAPDRHGSGTNALALARADPAGFAFGPGSLALHRARLPGAALVDLPGLALDLDDADDLDEAMRRDLLPIGHAAGSFAPPPH